MRRHMSRIALLLSILMLQFLVPYDVMALDNSAPEEEPVQTEQPATELAGHENEVELDPEISVLLGSLNDVDKGLGEHSMLLFELSDKRCEPDSKHFIGSDRTLTAVKYPLAVHYQLSEDGEHIVFYGNYSIRYNLNGTRFDAAHFYGSPYWVVSSSAKGVSKFLL